MSGWPWQPSPGKAFFVKVGNVHPLHVGPFFSRDLAMARMQALAALLDETIWLVEADPGSKRKDCGVVARPKKKTS